MNETAIVKPGEVDQEAVERLREQEEAAHAAGFSVRPPVFALGTRVVEVGADNFRRSREEFEALPYAQEALARLVDRVADERRQDTEIRVQELTMDVDGVITRGKARLMLTEHSFRQLLARTSCREPSAAATYLATIPPFRRALEVNAWIRETDEEATAIVRHRRAFGSVNGTSKREAFAIVSTRYVPRDVNEIAGDLRAALMREIAPGDARCVVEYDGNTASLTLQWHSDIQPETCAAGEIFRATAGFRTADDGSHAIAPFAGLTRNLCLNLIILDHAEIKLGRRRHTGNGIATFLADSLREATDRVRWFANKWDTARRQGLRDAVRDVPELASDHDMVTGAFRGLLAADRLSLPGIRRADAVTVLVNAFDKEPEYTRVGVVNAITRAAHETELRTPWAAGEVERQGAALLASDKPFQYIAEEDF